MTEEMTDDDLERIKPFASAAKNTFPSDFSSAMKEVMNEVDDGTKELVLTVMIDEQDNFVEYLTTMFKVQIPDVQTTNGEVNKMRIAESAN